MTIDLAAAMKTALCVTLNDNEERLRKIKNNVGLATIEVLV